MSRFVSARSSLYDIVVFQTFSLSILMDYKQLKEKVKATGQRVTKDVNGRRMKLTIKELRKKVRRNMENRVKNAKQTVGMCKSLLNMGTRVPLPPPPPPPVKRVVATRGGNVRPVMPRNLLRNLQGALNRRGLKQIANRNARTSVA
jgi:pyruvate/2-oxoglutarate dehydrogenase complex dihydrolipoamide dehydrogenase (E3) component